MGTKVILFPDIPVIVKNQVKKCVIAVHGTPIFLLDYMSKPKCLAYIIEAWRNDPRTSSTYVFQYLTRKVCIINRAPRSV